MKVKLVILFLIVATAVFCAGYFDGDGAKAAPPDGKKDCPSLTKAESHGRLVAELKKAHGLTEEGKAVLHGQDVTPGLQVLATDFPADAPRATQSRHRKSTVSWVEFYCGLGVGVQALWITSPGYLMADGFWTSYLGAWGHLELGVNNCPFYASSCLVSVLWDIAEWRSADAVRLSGSPYVIAFFDKWCIYA
jgi:hypothetical protein